MDERRKPVVPPGVQALDAPLGRSYLGMLPGGEIAAPEMPCEVNIGIQEARLDEEGAR